MGGIYNYVIIMAYILAIIYIVWLWESVHRFILLHAYIIILQHEKASEEMLDHLIGQNDLMAEFEKYELTRTDIEFIKKLINPEEYTNSDNWPYDDKLKEKSFLFEVFNIDIHVLIYSHLFIRL